MKKHDTNTVRKVVAAEKSEYVKAAVDFAFNNPAPVYEGSRTPTRSVLFTVRTPYEGMTKYAELCKDGWELDINFRYNLEKLSPVAPLQFAALAPQEYFDTILMPVIVMSAEAAYEREVAEHNKQVTKAKQEVVHREAVRKAIIAEREAELDRAVEERVRGNKQRPNYETMMNSGFVDA